MKRLRAPAKFALLVSTGIIVAACGRSSLDDDLLETSPVTTLPDASAPGTHPTCTADTISDPANCGACGNACPAGDACCNGACADTTSDLANCGACGGACAPGTDHCLDGLCCTPQPGGGAEVCGQPVCDCRTGQTCCGTGCFDTETDPQNCGACGNVCPNGGTCAASVCSVTCDGVQCASGASCCLTGCALTASDPQNCGICGNVCATGLSCTNGVCVGPCNDGPACAFGQSCCPSGCTPTTSDPANCGGCGIECGPTAGCIDGSCVASEGAFDPIVNPTYLPPGVHQYSTIDIPAGVTVYVAGAGPASGTLDLHATGAIEIDGTIDLTGGPGTQNTITSQNTETGRAGGGGFTGEPYATAGLSAACEFIGGNPGSLGFALAGTSGTCTVFSTTTCGTVQSSNTAVFAAPVALYGGGAGVFTGFRGYGSGGGGAAGGAPGALGAAYVLGGEADCTGAAGGGGAVNGNGGSGGPTPSAYDGAPGVVGVTQCGGYDGYPNAFVGGGGGGSIGAMAAADLAVVTTFQTGSGGGGASADYLDRPVFGGTSGGGGGGGALSFSTPATITINGHVLVNGGLGGDAVIGTPGPACNPQPGGGGGGGSGGVIVLSAPSITVGAQAAISAAGGAGGAQSEFATGGLGGTGGIGRIRLSVTPATCAIAGTLNPPLASGCTPTNSSGFTYVGTYPN